MSSNIDTSADAVATEKEAQEDVHLDGCLTAQELRILLNFLEGPRVQGITAAQGDKPEAK
jgi:hypothetical protein